jgi:benzoyl-CoA reductase/2-hydroxyglutaryl-CoA dehydratase subunit BcrC/BadD/HgdB
MEEKRDVIRFVADTLGSMRAHVAKKYPERKWIYDIRADYYEQASTAKERGQPVAWVNFCSCSELFWAMDIFPLFSEMTGVIQASFPEGLAKYIDIAEQYIPDHICSADKAFVGVALSGEMPLPDVIVHASSPCDSGLAAHSMLAEYFGIPHFCIDIPYWNDERSYQYVADELRNLVSFLEQKTKRKLDYEKLKQVAEYSKQAQEYILKINELRKAVPCPFGSRDMILDDSPIMMAAGTPELVDYCRRRYEIGKEMVSRKQGHLAEEKIRLAWIYVTPAFDLKLFDWLEKEYGAASVMEMLGNNVIEPIEDPQDISKIFRGLAGKVMNMPMGRECRGPWEYLGDTVVKTCRDYKADVAVWAGHVGCKHGWAAAKLVKDKVCDELGIPVMTFEVDVADPRVTSLEVIKAKFDDFFTVILRK